MCIIHSIHQSTPAKQQRSEGAGSMPGPLPQASAWTARAVCCWGRGCKGPWRDHSSWLFMWVSQAFTYQGGSLGFTIYHMLYSSSSLIYIYTMSCTCIQYLGGEVFFSYFREVFAGWRIDQRVSQWVHHIHGFVHWEFKRYIHLCSPLGIAFCIIHSLLLGNPLVLMSHNSHLWNQGTV